MEPCSFHRLFGGDDADASEAGLCVCVHAHKIECVVVVTEPRHIRI